METKFKINKIWSPNFLKRFLFEFLKVTIMELVKFNLILTSFW